MEHLQNNPSVIIALMVALVIVVLVTILYGRIPSKDPDVPRPKKTNAGVSTVVQEVIPDPPALPIELREPGKYLGWYCLGPSEVRVYVSDDGLDEIHFTTKTPSGYCQPTGWPGSSDGLLSGYAKEVYKVNGKRMQIYADGFGGWRTWEHFDIHHDVYGHKVYSRRDQREIEMRPPLPPDLVTPRQGAYY